MTFNFGTILLCILGLGLLTGIGLFIYSYLEASNLKIDEQDIDAVKDPEKRRRIPSLATSSAAQKVQERPLAARWSGSTASDRRC